MPYNTLNRTRAIVVCAVRRNHGAPSAGGAFL
jgi:hypothetical protein